MSTATLKRLAGVLAVALVLWAVLAVVRRSGTDRAVSFALPRIDTAAVDTVRIVHAGDSLLLARAPTGWRVNGHPAASSAVDALLRGLSDTLYWSELVAELPRSHPRFGVDSVEGRTLLVSSHGKVQLNLVTGKQTTDYGGVYVRRVDGDPVYALHSSLGDALTRSPDDWRDKEVVAVTPESVSVIGIQRGSRSYKLTRSGTAWKFSSGAAADSAAVASLLNQWHNVTGTGFATPAQLDSISFRRPLRQARLTSAGGRLLAAVAWDSTASGIWLRKDSGGDVFRTDAWTMNQLAPADSTLRAKKKR